MLKTSIQQLGDYGQSIWLDYISRPLLETGKLKSLIDQGLRGMTSNPSIFNQAIGSSTDYDKKIVQLKDQGKSSFEIYDELTIRDIQDAADQLKRVYDATNGLDGYVSLEINPLLAKKVDEQIKEGLRLAKKVNRPNVMIKVPSTEQGFKVFEELIASGINVNVTLIFSLDQYVKTAQAYMRGLERLSEKTSDLSRVHSVASVFVSRVDSTIDKTLDEKITTSNDSAQKERLQSLKGKAAVANCRMVFEKSKEIFASSEFKSLQSKKANVQRVLWASTSTKNPAYPDIKYVTELISAPTVNTLPEPTLMAFLDHGKFVEAFTDQPQNADKIIQELKSVGIDINSVCLNLLDDGCSSFDKAFETLLASIEKKASQLCAK